MIGAVHAAVGAVVGTLAGSPTRAFAGAAATHLLLDMLPHKDFHIKVEAPLAAAMMGLLIWRCGIRSQAVLGAAGGMAPDVENALYVLGILPQKYLVFPTHVDGGVIHGRKVESALPQFVGAAVCLAFVLRRCR